MPERTRDHKFWFPRFKSSHLGNYRTNDMFVCCECATFGQKYRACRGLHCNCGKDEWKLAKKMEQAEYERRTLKFQKDLLGKLPRKQAMQVMQKTIPSNTSMKLSNHSLENDPLLLPPLNLSRKNSDQYTSSKRMKFDSFSSSTMDKQIDTAMMEWEMVYSMAEDNSKVYPLDSNLPPLHNFNENQVQPFHDLTVHSNDSNVEQVLSPVLVSNHSLYDGGKLDAPDQFMYSDLPEYNALDHCKKPTLCLLSPELLNDVFVM